MTVAELMSQLERLDSNLRIVVYTEGEGLLG